MTLLVVFGQCGLVGGISLGLAGMAYPEYYSAVLCIEHGMRARQWAGQRMSFALSACHGV